MCFRLFVFVFCVCVFEFLFEFLFALVVLFVFVFVFTCGACVCVLVYVYVFVFVFLVVVVVVEVVVTVVFVVVVAFMFMFMFVFLFVFLFVFVVVCMKRCVWCIPVWCMYVLVVSRPSFSPRYGFLCDPSHGFGAECSVQVTSYEEIMQNLDQGMKMRYGDLSFLSAGSSVPEDSSQCPYWVLFCAESLHRRL